MTSTANLLPGPPAFFDDGSEFGRSLEAVRREIAGDEGEWAAGVDWRTVTDMRVSVRDGHARLKGLYWSRQSTGGGSRTQTLFVDVGHETAVWRTFPDDPSLGSIAAVLERFADYDVLRYIPGRRLTVRARAHDSGVAIVKFKKPDRVGQAAAALEAVVRAWRADGPPSFRVPRVIGVDPATNTFVQEYCDGDPLDPLVGTPALVRGERLGRIHAEVHGMSANLPRLDPHRVRADLEREIAILAALVPEAADVAARCRALLAVDPASGEARVVCHGDLAGDAILVGASGWSIVDWDRAHLGNRLHDIAVCLASDALSPTAGDVRALQAAYLNGYRAVATVDLNLDQLTPWLACEELRALSVAVRKGRWDPRAARARLDRAEALCEGSWR